MKCPTCGTGVTIVTDSREGNKFNGTVRRRRECKNGHKFTTYEISAEILATSGILKLSDANKMQAAVREMMSIAIKTKSIIDLLEGTDIETLREDVATTEKVNQKLWEGTY